jgi:Fe-Mn family superoxide dismutase
MAQFEEKKFNIGELKGISAKTIEEHLKLYSGYVTHANKALQRIEELYSDAEKDTYGRCEMERRFSFEYNGIRNHEIYFDLLSGGASELDTNSGVKKEIEKEWGSFETWLQRFKSLATVRGIGWAMLYWDRKDKRLLHAWVDEQHLGQLQDCAPIIALDMWEHSYVADYQPSGKKQYVEDFFSNLNWSKAEENFLSAQ